MGHTGQNEKQRKKRKLDEAAGQDLSKLTEKEQKKMDKIMNTYKGWIRMPTDEEDTDDNDEEEEWDEPVTLLPKTQEKQRGNLRGIKQIHVDEEDWDRVEPETPAKSIEEKDLKNRRRVNLAPESKPNMYPETIYELGEGYSVYISKYTPPQKPQFRARNTSYPMLCVRRQYNDDVKPWMTYIPMRLIPGLTKALLNLCKEMQNKPTHNNQEGGKSGNEGEKSGNGNVTNGPKA